MVENIFSLEVPAVSESRQFQGVEPGVGKSLPPLKNYSQRGLRRRERSWPGAEALLFPAKKRGHVERTIRTGRKAIKRALK